MLTQAQIDEYNTVGAIVVPDILTPAEVQRLRDVTDGFVERARGLTTHDRHLRPGGQPHAGEPARAAHQGDASARIRNTAG